LPNQHIIGKSGLNFALPGSDIDSNPNLLSTEAVTLMKKRKVRLSAKYPPSQPCACEICIHYCTRPGWWTVEEAAGAIDAGYAHRMMVEMAPEMTFAVLSPAFNGCEGNFALQEYADRGCTFFTDNRCELHGTGHQPLECRFCHHDRRGLGRKCHADLERDWRTSAGRTTISKWIAKTGFTGLGVIRFH
jgi:hypothetical protein